MEKNLPTGAMLEKWMQTATRTDMKTCWQILLPILFLHSWFMWKMGACKIIISLQTTDSVMSKTSSFRHALRINRCNPGHKMPLPSSQAEKRAAMPTTSHCGPGHRKIQHINSTGWTYVYLLTVGSNDATCIVAMKSSHNPNILNLTNHLLTSWDIQVEPSWSNWMQKAHFKVLEKVLRRLFSIISFIETNPWRVISPKHLVTIISKLYMNVDIKINIYIYPNSECDWCCIHYKAFMHLSIY